MKKLGQYVFASTIAVALSACVPSHTVSTKNIGDEQLKCDDIATRIAEIKGATKLVKSKQGASGENVAAALFFWPALIFNSQTNSSSIDSLLRREEVLIGLYQSNSCSNTFPEYTTDEMKEKIKSGETQEAFN